MQPRLVGDVGDEGRDPRARGASRRHSALVSAMSSADTSHIATWHPGSAQLASSSRPIPEPAAGDHRDAPLELSSSAKVATFTKC